MFDKDAIEALQKGNAIHEAGCATFNALHGDLEKGLEAKGIAALPDDFSIHDLEKHLPERRRARGGMSTENLPSFAAYTHQHAEDGASVFVNQDAMTAVAVLNLGSPTGPGHADNTATLHSKRTAAFVALQNISSGSVKQATAAEWLEDWAPHIKCFSGTDAVAVGVAVQSVRNLTIEAFRKLEATEEALSSTTSAFESVKASSKTTLPTLIYFSCVPYHGFNERTFVLRLGVLTGDSKPVLTLRIVKMEEHTQEMAEELTTRVEKAINPPTLPVIATDDGQAGDGELFTSSDLAKTIPVLIGTYKAAN